MASPLKEVIDRILYKFEASTTYERVYTVDELIKSPISNYEYIVAQEGPAFMCIEAGWRFFPATICLRLPQIFTVNDCSILEIAIKGQSIHLSTKQLIHKFFKKYKVYRRLLKFPLKLQNYKTASLLEVIDFTERLLKSHLKTKGRKAYSVSLNLNSTEISPYHYITLAGNYPGGKNGLLSQFRNSPLYPVINRVGVSGVVKLEAYDNPVSTPQHYCRNHDLERLVYDKLKLFIMKGGS